MITTLGAAFVAGLMGSPHCVGMCGGFAGACTTRWTDTLAWSAGRLWTYAWLGALAGAAGASIPGPDWVPGVVSGVLLVWFAARLAGFAPAATGGVPVIERTATWLLGQSGVGARFAFGIVNGLLPCGLVYAALSVPMASSNPLLGAAAMVAFGIGTIPALAFASGIVRQAATRHPALRIAMAAAVLVGGLWSIDMRWPTADESGQVEAPHCH